MTLILGALVVLLVMALLGLSQRQIKIEAGGRAKLAAQANARVALALAVGQLQVEAGDDRRVTATAHAVLDAPAQPRLTGVWNAWRWTPSKTGAPDYTAKASQFRRWLVSSAKQDDPAVFTFPASTPAADAVPMVKSSTAPLAARYADAKLEPSRDVSAGKILLNVQGRAGGVAWATFDESAKAPLQVEERVDTSVAGNILRRTAPARVRPDIIDKDAKLAPLKTARNLVTVDTAALALAAADSNQARGRLHDFTAESKGLLTNVAEGGLRVDLTSLFEAPATTPMAAMLGAATPYFTDADGAPTWDYLRDHYRLYKRAQDLGATAPRMDTTAVELSPSTTKGMTAAPATERLLPVIAKMQILFSMVSHHAHIWDRVAFLNNLGDPRGNDKHAVPHLAYDPVITLYNPYDVALELDKLRVRVWDPPVGFRFRKKDVQKNTEVFYRPGGEFHGLARMCYQTEYNPNTRKSFTLFLREMGGSAPGGKIKLLPGETRVFSAWVNNDWTWGWETADGYNVRAFFDFAADKDFGNRDGRTKNPFGVEAVPGWDTRAGLQTDHMGYAWRDQSTLYDFEKQPGARVGGFVSLRLTDEVVVEAQPMRVLPPGNPGPDFIVDLMAGDTVDYTDSADVKYNSPKDLLRRYEFRFGNVTSEVSAVAARPVIQRRFLNKDIMQTPQDRTPGGKSPFAILSMTAKTTRDPLDDSKAWLYNNPVVEGTAQNTNDVGLANQSYDLKLQEVADFTTFPGIEIDPATKRGFFGASSTAYQGVTNVPMFRVPVLPAASLGELVHANLIAGGGLPRVTHALGNANAHPLVPSATVARALGAGTLPDHCYLLNDTLWDRYFFSSATDYAAAQKPLTGREESRQSVLEAFFKGANPLLNPRYLPNPGVAGAPAARARALDGMADNARAKRMAAEMLVNGSFNINSTSVDAWRAVLSSSRDQAVTGWAKQNFPNLNLTPFARHGLPLTGTGLGTGGSADVKGQVRWAGFATLTDAQINGLSQAIVREIRKRGILDKAPALTLGEFVNRRIGAATPSPALPPAPYKAPDKPNTLTGLLQTAIDASGVNVAAHALDSKPVLATALPQDRMRGALNPDAMTGYTGEGAPPVLTQGDLMAALSTVATARGDTFKIRAYGESLDRNGSVAAKVWCEAVVQRVPEFVDAAGNAAETAPSSLNHTNQRFGRRFQITSFRWLGPGEI